MLKIHDSLAGWGHHIKAFVGVGHGKHSRWLAVISKGPLKGLGHWQEYTTLGYKDFLGHGNPHYTTVFFLFFRGSHVQSVSWPFQSYPLHKQVGGDYETHQSLNKASYWILVCRGEWFKPSKWDFFLFDDIFASWMIYDATSSPFFPPLGQLCPGNTLREHISSKSFMVSGLWRPHMVWRCKERPNVSWMK